MTPTDQHEEDLRIIAQFIVAASAEGAEWAEWPEIGEHDWMAIQNIVTELTPVPDMNAYQAAYERLEARANAWAGSE